MLFFSTLASFATAVAAISIHVGDRYDSSLDVGSLASGITSERDVTLARPGAIEERKNSNANVTMVHIPASSATGGESFDVSISTDHPTPGNLMFDIFIPIGSPTFQFRGDIEEASLYADIGTYVKLPLTPSQPAGKAKGDLRDGLRVTFSLEGVSGDIQFFARQNWMWTSFDITEFGKRHRAQFQLIQIIE